MRNQKGALYTPITDPIIFGIYLIGVVVNGAVQPQNLWDERVIHGALTDRERALRDQFVNEYLTDYDAWAATIRLGFVSSIAGQYAQIFMECPYVRQQITTKQQQTAADPKAEQDALKQQIKAWLIQQANYRGPGASHGGRVQALGLLAKMNKLIDADDDGASAASKEERLVQLFREFAQKAPV